MCVSNTSRQKRNTAVQRPQLRDPNLNVYMGVEDSDQNKWLVNFGDINILPRRSSVSAQQYGYHGIILLPLPRRAAPCTVTRAPTMVSSPNHAVVVAVTVTFFHRPFFPLKSPKRMKKRGHANRTVQLQRDLHRLEPPIYVH